MVMFVRHDVLMDTRKQPIAARHCLVSTGITVQGSPRWSYAKTICCEVAHTISIHKPQ